MRALRWAVVLAVLVPMSGMGAGLRAERPGDKGEGREAMALKGRRAAPKPADLDPAVSLDALLARGGEKDWSTAKAGTVEGYVIQVEKEEDGDLHMVLAAAAGETSTTKWVIVEVGRAWRKRDPKLSEARLRALAGKRVRATGWLFYEPDTEAGDPRGTRWELHPVTALEVL